MEPGRDLAGVARLIQTAFADELDRAGQAALREMHSMSRLGPLLWWLDRTSLEFSELLSGFVWVEEGQIVGNATISRAAPGSQRWIISNVAVAELYRGRGIGRVLMDAAMELVREWGGRIVTLQVRHNNPPALRLYHSLGFREIFGTTDLRLDRVPKVQPLPVSHGKLRPRRFSAADAQLRYELARAATPEEVQMEQPVRFTAYRLGVDQAVADLTRRLAGGGPTLRLVLDMDDHLGAAITAGTGTWWREGRLSLTVRPALRGQVERDLISHALHHLGHRRRRVVLARQPTFHPEAIEALKSFGFRELRTLLWMRRDL
jgi:ribosomal protein S18 acetylase RimI-like enzyme